MTALLAALATTAVVAPAANANLSAVGPVDPATTFPHWYGSADGTQLELCVNQPNCLPPVGPLTAPDGEAFYYNAQATADVDGGTAQLTLAVEAAFAGTDPITFGRRQVLVKALPNRTYTFQDPYGSGTVVTNASGVGRFRSQVGCAVPPAPCDFGAALGTEIGPFLRWDPSVGPAAPARTLGDALTPHAVTGSPIGRNSFTVTGVGTGTTKQFVVSGLLASPPTPVINAPASVDFGSTPVGVPVQKTITVRSFGVPGAGSALTVGAPILGGDLPAGYSVVANSCGAAMPSGQTCNVVVQFTPTAGGAQPATLILPSNATGGNGNVALTGTGVAPAPAAAPAAAVAGASASSRLAIRKLHLSHKMRRSRVLRNGLRLSMVLPQGTEIIKVAVFKYRGHTLRRTPVWVGFRVAPSRLGLYRMTLDSRSLRRRLKVGRYQLRVTPGASKQQLGLTTFTTLRVTRG